MKIGYLVLFLVLLCFGCTKPQTATPIANQDTTFSYITYYDSVISCNANRAYTLV